MSSHRKMKKSLRRHKGWSLKDTPPTQETSSNKLPDREKQATKIKHKSKRHGTSMKSTLDAWRGGRNIYTLNHYLTLITTYTIIILHTIVITKTKTK